MSILEFSYPHRPWNQSTADTKGWLLFYKGKKKKKEPQTKMFSDHNRAGQKYYYSINMKSTERKRILFKPQKYPNSLLF